MIYAKNILFKIKKRESDKTISNNLLQIKNNSIKMGGSQQDIVKALGGIPY